MFDFSLALGGCEAINYQASSPFRTSMVDFFQKWIDISDEIKQRVYNEPFGDAYKKRTIVAEKIKDEFNKNGVKEFTAIVKKFTGFEIKTVQTVYDPYCRFFYGLYACEMVYDGQDNISAITNMNRMAGTYRDMLANAPQAEKYREWLNNTDLSDYFDPTTGKMTSNTFNNGKNKMTIRKVYIDIGHAFMHDMVLNTNVAEPLTAEELAAIMLHEIGHCMSGAEHFGDAYLRTMRANQFLVTVNNIKNRGDTKSAIATLKAINRAIPTLKKRVTENNSNTETTKIAERTINCIESVSNTILKAAENNDAFFAATGKFLFLILYGIVFLYVACLLCAYVGSINLLLKFYTESAKRLGTANTVNGKKTSDTSANYSHMYTLERWADQYAERQGCGTDLITALQKFKRDFDVLGSAGMYNFVSGSKFNIAVLDLIHSLISFFIGFNVPSLNYEDDYHRAIRICEDMRSFFKNIEHVPASLVKDWLIRIDAAEKAAVKNRSIKNNDFVAGLLNALENVTNPANWMTMLIDGKLDRDLENLENNISKLNNNNLFRLAAEVKYM